MVDHMSEQQLTDILKAASDTTRRSILTTLVQEGATRVTDLAEHYDMSLNAVSKHIKVLESAGLVTRKTLGRVHLIEANLAPVSEIDNWFQNLRSIWELRLDKLESLLVKEENMSELSLNVSRTIKAPIESVFNAWLDPEMIAKFMIPAKGVIVPKAETDAREGGRFDIIMVAGEKEMPHGGEYKKISPYSQIAFTWESPFSIEGSVVTLNFSQVEEGTNVELIHVKFPDEESRANHEGGWTAILICLDGILA